MKVTLSLATIAAAVALAACGSSSSSSNSGGSGSSSSGSSGSGSSTPVSLHSDVNLRKTNLGSVLVDHQGHTLYMFEKDKGGKSACSGPCATNWPPVIAKGKPTAGAGADAKLGTTKRSDGSMQVTYAGQPVYAFVGDKAAGDTTGQDQDAFGGEWYAMTASGGEAHGKGAKASDGSSSSSGGSSGGGSSKGGYGY